MKSHFHNGQPYRQLPLTAVLHTAVLCSRHRRTSRWAACPRRLLARRCARRARLRPRLRNCWQLSVHRGLLAIQLAIQAAVSNSFKTPEVIAMFAKADSDGLRNRGVALRRDKDLGKISEAAFNAEMVEILAGLSKLGVDLTPEEKHVLDQSANRDAFTAATGSMGEGTIDAALSIAAQHNTAAAASSS